jgi:WD40 repeat protein
VKVFTLPGSTFVQVAYLDPQRLVTASYSGGSRSLRVWSLTSESPPAPVHWMQSAAVWELFTPGGGEFLRRQGLWPDGSELPVTTTPGSELVDAAMQLPNMCRYAAFSPHDRLALCAETVVTRGRYSTHFHLRTGTEPPRPVFHAPTAVRPAGCFSPCGALVAMSGGEPTVAVWDARDLWEVCNLPLTDKTQAMTFAADNHLAVAAGRTVRLWEMSGGNLVRTWPAFKKYVEALAVSPDGRRLAAGSRDGTVRVWEVASGGEMARYDWGVGAVRQVAFSPDGTTAAAAADHGLVVWDLE